MDYERRHHLAGIAALPFLSSGTALSATAPASPTAKSAVSAPKLTTSEMLMYSTVRLDLGVQTGTGFVFSFFNDGVTSVIGIVSAAHVFLKDNNRKAGLSSVQFGLNVRKADGSTDIGNTTFVKLNDLNTRVLFHPDPNVDLAVMLIGDVVNNLEKRGILLEIVPLSPTIIPTDTDLKDMDPLQNIVTVGYPGQLWDSKNNLPVFHRGSTASAPYVDFLGKKEFVIDIATWPGASGSPVLILDQGTIFNPRTSGLSFGSRVVLIGVVYAVARQELDGSVYFMFAPTTPVTTSDVSASLIPTNLGVVLDHQGFWNLSRCWRDSGSKSPLATK